MLVSVGMRAPPNENISIQSGNGHKNITSRSRVFLHKGLDLIDEKQTKKLGLNKKSNVFFKNIRDPSPI